MLLKKHEIIQLMPKFMLSMKRDLSKKPKIGIAWILSSGEHLRYSPDKDLGGAPQMTIFKLLPIIIQYCKLFPDAGTIFMDILYSYAIFQVIIWHRVWAWNNAMQ